MPSLRLTFALLAALVVSGCDGVIGLVPLNESSGSTEPSSTSWGEMLQAVNAMRAEGQQCGDEYFAPVAPLVWNGRLEAAAQRHTRDMARHEHFAHTGTDGSSVGDRASYEGYDWRRVGENIARYQLDVHEVVDDWMASPGHCANLMNPAFVEFGAAEEDHYWTQVFGKPR